MSNSTEAEVVAEWRAAIEGADEGPWEVREYGDGDSLVIHSGDDWRICFMATPGSSPGAMRKIESNARFIARCSPSGISGLLALIESQRATIERVERERDEARSYASLGCDAADGGAHSLIRQGAYQFCGACGETIKNPSLAERARAAEARVTALEAEMARKDALLRRMSDALLEVRPLGGSELFMRVGEEFYADPCACTAEIRRLRSDLHEARSALVKERRSRQALSRSSTEVKDGA